jgi:hypothetical protein
LLLRIVSRDDLPGKLALTFKLVSAHSHWCCFLATEMGFVRISENSRLYFFKPRFTRFLEIKIWKLFKMDLAYFPAAAAQ